MRLPKPTYAVLVIALSAALGGCGSEGAGRDVATDEPSTPTASSLHSTPTPTVDPMKTPEPKPSVDPDPAVVEGLDLTFTQDALTMTLEVPDLVETDRLLVLYRWQTRDVRVAVETTLVGGEPVLNAVWADNQTESSGDVKDVDAAWDLDAGTVTITLRDRLNGDQAEVSALGLGPRDRYPVEPPPYAVTERVQRS